MGQSVVVAGQVRRVGKKDVTSGVKYEVEFSDGNTWVTFDLPLAERAFGMIGQTATLTGEINNKKRGDRTFVNYDLKDLVPGAQAGASPASEQAPAQSRIPQAGENLGEKDARIVRGNAINAAAAVLAGSGASTEEVLAYAEEFAGFIFGTSGRGSGAVVGPSASEQQIIADAEALAEDPAPGIPWNS